MGVLSSYTTGDVQSLSFSSSYNVQKGDNGTLKGNGNIIDLTGLATAGSVTVDGVTYNPGTNFENLVFRAETMTNCSIDTYKPTRLRLYIRYNYRNSSPTSLSTSSDNSYFNGHTISKNHIQSQAMLIDGSKLGREFHLYLQTTFTDSNNEEYSMLNEKHRSDGNPAMMRALTAFGTTGSPLDKGDASSGLIHDLSEQLGISTNDCSYMVLGCEDANGKRSDWDYNDVVLLVIGLPDIPKIARDIVQKRYLIEDLGSTFDFDFNDIVVDVIDEKVYEANDVNYARTQTVSIAHLCGTIPFQVFIGNTPMSQDPMMGNNNNDNPDGYNPKTANNYYSYYVKEFTGTQDSDFPWNPTTNNISVLVWPQHAGMTS